MTNPRHTEDERKAIIEGVHTSGRPIAEIVAGEGISRQTIQSWMRVAPSQRNNFIEIPTPRATVVELGFADGTVLRIQG
jgi:transposase-like protein